VLKNAKAGRLLINHIKTGAALCLMISATTAASLDVTVTIATDDDDLRDRVTKSIQLDDVKNEAGGPEILAAAQGDYSRIIGALFDRGRFGPEVSITLDGVEAASIAPISPPRDVQQAVITISPGSVYQFGTAEIGPRPPGTMLTDQFRSGSEASVAVIREVARTTISNWRNVGHAKADVAGQQITARHEANQVDAEVTIDPGPRLTFGNLDIKGETIVSNKRIRNISGLPRGDVFSPAELQRAERRLQRTGTFSIATLTEADEISEGDRLNINANVVDATPRRIGFGAEISSVQGLTISGFWLHRNFLGGAERFRVDAEVSDISNNTDEINAELSFRFDRPAIWGPETDLYLEGGIESLNEPTFSSDRARIALGALNRGSDTLTTTVGFGLETARTEDAFGKRDYTIFTIPLTAEEDRRDDPISATSGVYAKLGLTPFLAISGTDHGLRGTLDLRGYRQVGDRVVFALRGQAGALWGPEISNAPPEFLFHSGGGGTVRGQPFQSLSLQAANGEDTGGRSFLGLSSEVRVSTAGRLGFVGFYDLGYVGPEEFPDASTGEWHSGAGLGLRYDTGIGPIRLDVGVPVTGPDSNEGVALYIGIGQSF